MMVSKSAVEISLVTQQPQHADGLFDALRDPAIYRFLDGPPPASAADIRARIERVLRGPPAEIRETWLNWTVFADGKIVGYTQATLHDDHAAELAYVFSPEVWGKGIAWRACTETLRLLAGAYAVTRFSADTDVANTPSQNLLRRLGFVETGRVNADAFFEIPVDPAA